MTTLQIAKHNLYAPKRCQFNEILPDLSAHGKITQTTERKEQITMLLL